MRYMIDITRWDDTESGIDVNEKTNAYTLFHALFSMACNSCENIKNITLWEINPGVSVDILKSVDF